MFVVTTATLKQRFTQPYWQLPPSQEGLKPNPGGSWAPPWESVPLLYGGSVLQDSMAMTGGTAAALPMSNHTRERVTVAKLTLENFYSTLLTQHEEREMR